MGGSSFEIEEKKGGSSFEIDKHCIYFSEFFTIIRPKRVDLFLRSTSIVYILVSFSP